MFNVSRRQILCVAASATLLPAVPAAAMAQIYPLRPISMVVPFSAGGGTDVTARIVADGLSDALGQRVVVENMPAAGGTIAASRVARAAPDGYQFLFGSIATQVYSQFMYTKQPYNAATDFAPVGLIAEQPLVLLTRPDFPADTLPQFIAHTKIHQGKMQYASPGGVGSANHLACVFLNATIGVTVNHVPYRGTTSFQDMIASRIDYQCPLASNAVAPLIESKQVRAIAIFANERVSVLPTVATAHEQGLADFEAYTWQALFLPKAVPKPIIERLHGALAATIGNPLVQERLKQTGSTVVAAERRSTEYLAGFLPTEINKWGKVIRAANIKPE